MNRALLAVALLILGAVVAVLAVVLVDVSGPADVRLRPQATVPGIPTTGPAVGITYRFLLTTTCGYTIIDAEPWAIDMDETQLNRRLEKLPGGAVWGFARLSDSDHAVFWSAGWQLGLTRVGWNEQTKNCAILN